MQTLIRATRAYQLLKAEGEKSRFSHAYLVHFDDARNLRACLKSFAKLFFNLFENENEQNPQKKRIANLIEDERFSDCLFYPKNGDKFLVEDAEKITEECLLQPVEQNKKVFVISDFDQANASAQNKLLKLLEEPPKGVIFLLGTTSVYPVLSTVLSRVEKLEIPPFNPEDIASALKRTHENFSQSGFELCAAACGGCLGTAQNMLEGGFYRSLLSDAFSLCLAKSQDLPKLIKSVGEIKQKKEFLSLLRIVFRDALLLKTKQKESFVFLRSEKETLLKIAQNYPSSTLLFAQKELSNTEQQLFFNTVFPQAMEILFIKIFQNKEKIW